METKNKRDIAKEIDQEVLKQLEISKKSWEEGDMKKIVEMPQ